MEAAAALIDMALMSSGGLPLFVNGGLTMDPNCCCGDTPPPGDCPQCCISIDWGIFDEDGNLWDDYDLDDVTIEVKIILPNPGNRIVCDDEVITVEWKIIGDLPMTTGGHIIFGTAWEHQGHSPEIGENGEIYRMGLVDWGNEHLSREYSTSLRLHSCFLDSPFNLAHITIGLDAPDFSQELTVSRCSYHWCCSISSPCEDCCAKIGTGDLIRWNNDWWKVSESIIDGLLYRMVVRFQIGSEKSPGLICVGEGVNIEIELIPPRQSHVHFNTNITVEHPFPWGIGHIDPPQNEENESTDQSTNWGPMPNLKYKITLASSCNCEGKAEFPPITIHNPEYGVISGIGFGDCNMDDCCCEPDCLCDCIFPMPDDFCETAVYDPIAPTIYPPYSVPGVDITLSDFRIEVTASDEFMSGDFMVTGWVIEQTGESRLHGNPEIKNGKCCPNTPVLGAPARETSPQYPMGIGGLVGVNMSYLDECDPNLVVWLDGFGDSDPQHHIVKASLAGCSTIEWSETKVINGITYQWNITGTISGALKCDCNTSGGEGD